MGAVGWSNGRSYRSSGGSYCFNASEMSQNRAELCSNGADDMVGGDCGGWKKPAQGCFTTVNSGSAVVAT